MIPGTTPAAPDDAGEADPALTAALATSDDNGAIAVALVRARLLVPVVALPSDGDAAMAVPALVAPDGRQALPVFSSYETLRAWRPDARPVPMPGYRAVAGAVAEGYAGLVLDVAGPVPFEVDGDDLRLLADLAARLAVDPSQRVAIVSEAGSVTDC